ncbi:MAG: diaminopimelate epimerase [Bacteroidota bacterium]
MSTLHFYKYHGTGNDFIIIDDRNNFFDLTNNELVKKLCDRRFGIGADGLMLLQKSVDTDFQMLYYNSDGKPGSMCGNGGRCIVAFAKHLGIINERTTFKAIDGIHNAVIIDYSENKSIVELEMIDVSEVKSFDNYSILDTGSPHYVQFVDDAESININEIGPAIRYNSIYGKFGVNVNFVELIDSHTLFVRTYERGVEAETLSCGTGVTASALVACSKSILGGNEIDIITKGGKLSVGFQKNISSFVNVKLKGPAELVFEGEFQI